MNVSQQVDFSVPPSFREYTVSETMKSMQKASPGNFSIYEGMEPKINKSCRESSKTKNFKVQKKEKRGKKKWKKPEGKPKRPLSAYNLFFRNQRAAMLGDDIPSPMMELLKKRVHCKTHGKIGFAEMAREIGRRWKALDPENKKDFEDKAKEERQRYDIELAKWKESLRMKEDTSALDTVSNAAMLLSDSDSIHSCEKSVDSTLEDSYFSSSTSVENKRCAENETKEFQSPQAQPLSPASMPNLVYPPVASGSSSYYDRIAAGTSIPMASRFQVLQHDRLFLLQQMMMNPAPTFGASPVLPQQIWSGSIPTTASDLAFLAQTEYRRQQMIAVLFQR